MCVLTISLRETRITGYTDHVLGAGESLAPLCLGLTVEQFHAQLPELLFCHCSTRLAQLDYHLRTDNTIKFSHHQPPREFMSQRILGKTNTSQNEVVVLSVGSYLVLAAVKGGKVQKLLCFCKKLLLCCLHFKWHHLPRRLWISPT